jgi:competence protein ComEC
MLMIQPKLLRDDMGFQLSFLAVLGLAYLYPIINNWLEKGEKSKIGGKILRLPLVKPMAEIINLTIAAQIFTWPILAFSFNQVSLIAPLANLLALWTMPAIMAGSVVGLLLSIIMPVWQIIFFLPVKILSAYLVGVVTILANIPYAYFETGAIWWGWLVVYYLFLAAIFLKRKKVIE